MKNVSLGYLSALSSGYVLMGANLLIQFALTPFYLDYLGEQSFGMLMMLLNLINFAAIGITWMSGGLVRVMGESWARSDFTNFRNVFAVGKYVFTLYAILAVSLGYFIWFIWGDDGSDESVSAAVILAGIYLVLNYEALTERQAFVGSNKQDIGNYIELSRVLFFAGLTYFLLPKLQNMTAVWISLMSGVLLQRVITGLYWRKCLGNTGWKRFTPVMKPILERLAGKQGAGYVGYGALLLLLQADTMIMGFIGGAEVAGQFVLLWKIPEAIGLLLWRIPSTIEPKVIHLDASGQHEALRSIFTRGRRWYFLLLLTASLVYMIVGQWLATLWVGEHAPVESWMYIASGVALFFNSFARWPISFSYALIKLSPLIKIALVEVVSKIVLIIILFPYTGIASPIVALIITHACYVAWAYQKTMSYGVRTI